ncbi:MAG: toll/interleukin-1 receptor domain-containing protein [Bacteroidota bacterium]
MKEIIFISHANPEDNYFAAWLASKLRLLGYNAWVDVEDFRTGDAFFTKIGPLIKEHSTKFIAVTSKDYLKKAKDQNTGVSKELNTAINVRDVENFIMPIRLDNSKYSDFPTHYASMDSIDFNGNWQKGLINTVQELEKADVSKGVEEENPTQLWFKAIGNQNKLINREEIYFSNWFASKIPEKIWVHWLEVNQKVDIEIPYPLIIEGDHIITFCNKSSIERFIRVRNSTEFNTEDFRLNSDLPVDEFYMIIEPKKKLVKLMNVVFNRHLENNGLKRIDNRNLYYFPKGETGERSVSLRKRYGKTSRVLTGIKSLKVRGETKKFNWHYALIPRFDCYPSDHFKLFYTIICEDQEGKVLGKKMGLKLRRAIPATWFNRKWYELLLAGMLKVSDSLEAEFMTISVSDNANVIVNNFPENSSISKGYKEP